MRKEIQYQKTLSPEMQTLFKNKVALEKQSLENEKALKQKEKDAILAKFGKGKTPPK